MSHDADAEAVLAYLSTQDAALRAGDRALRAGDVDAVHRTRVGARRARSTLRTFGTLFLPAARDEAVASLREYAAALGPVRDLQVLRELLAEETPDGLAAWIVEDVERSLAAQWARLGRELAGPEACRAPDLTATLALRPDDAAGRPGRRAVQRAVRKAGRRAERRLTGAGDDIERLHDARKAAKRARYAAEAVGELSEAHRFERVQDALGRHRDLLTAAAWLDRTSPPTALLAEVAELAARLRAEADRVRAAAVL